MKKARNWGFVLYANDFSTSPIDSFIAMDRKDPPPICIRRDGQSFRLAEKEENPHHATARYILGPVGMHEESTIWHELTGRPDPMDVVWAFTLVDDERSNTKIAVGDVTGIRRPPQTLKRNGVSYRVVHYECSGIRGTARYLLCPVGEADWSDWHELKGEKVKDQDWIVALFETDSIGVPPIAACIIRGCPSPPACIEWNGRRYRILRSETMMCGPGHAKYVFTEIQSKHCEAWEQLAAENTEEADSDEVSFFTCVIGGRHLNSGLINELRGAWIVGLVYARPGGLTKKGPCTHKRTQGTIDSERTEQIVKCADCGALLRFVRSRA
jgi:hypothetical protein